MAIESCATDSTIQPTQTVLQTTRGEFLLERPIHVLPSDRILPDVELVLFANELRPYLADRSLEEQIALVETWIKPQVTASHIHEYRETGDISVLPVEIRATIDRVNAERQALEESIAESEIRFSLGMVVERLQTADRHTGGRPAEVRAAARLAIGPYQVVSDLDNTLTDHSRLNIVEGIDPTLVGSSLADPLNTPTRDNFPELYAAVWRPLLISFPEVFAAGGEKAPLRHGVEELFGYLLQQEDLPISILSTNFRPFPEAAIRRVAGEQAGEIELYTVNAHDPHQDRPVHEGNIVAADKGNVLQHLAARDNGRAIIYLGDGGSDRPALSPEARSIVAAYFALEGGSFHKQLLEAQQEDPSIIFFTYTSALQIREKLEELAGLTEILTGAEEPFYMRRERPRYQPLTA